MTAIGALAATLWIAAAPEPAAVQSAPTPTAPAAAPESARDAPATSRAAGSGAPVTDADRATRAAEATRYGDWLLARGDAYRAIGEYERALYVGGELAADALELRIARAYAEGGRADAAASHLLRVEGSGRDPAVRREALLERARVRYAAGQPALALDPARAFLSSARGDDPARTRASLLLALAQLRTGDGPAAIATLQDARGGPTEHDLVEQLRVAVVEADRAPRRSLVAAGLLSAVVPGLGHAYAGDPLAGAGALALNGLFVWGTVEAYRDRRWALGSLLLVGESLWYGGAIFGAVSEAARFNRDARERAVSSAEERFRWVFAAGPLPGGAGVSIGGSTR